MRTGSERVNTILKEVEEKLLIIEVRQALIAYFYLDILRSSNISEIASLKRTAEQTGSQDIVSTLDLIVELTQLIEPALALAHIKNLCNVKN